MSGYPNVDGLTYHGVPVPQDLFLRDEWGLVAAESWRRGVDDALEALTPLLKPGKPAPDNRECAVCIHLGWQHDLPVQGVSQARCSRCHGNSAHSFMPKVST